MDKREGRGLRETESTLEVINRQVQSERGEGGARREKRRKTGAERGRRGKEEGYGDNKYSDNL